MPMKNENSNASLEMYRILNYLNPVDESHRIVSAKGNILIDKSGNELLDFGLGAGSQILGHSSSIVLNAIKRQAELGCIYIEESEQIHKLAQQLALCLPKQISNYVFCNSGTEATYRALRYARIATGKSKIACFNGSWHGMNEWVMTDGGGRFSDGAPRLLDGVPQIVASDSIRLPFDNFHAFNLLKEHADETAAVILEPIFGSAPRLALDFLQELIVFCKKHNILVIFDEIITGFRLALGGAAEKIRLIPDIATYGKILGGGMPIGLVGISSEVMERINKNGAKVTAGGTFSANPLVAHVAGAIIEELNKMNYNEIDEMADTFRNALNRRFLLANIDMGVQGYGSISRLAFTSGFYKDRNEREKLECSVNDQLKFKNLLRSRGYIWPGSGLIFNSFCHNQSDLDGFADTIFCIATEIFDKT
jgi:glutamate-1-semialdehyde 2,1-aminomutase